MASPCSTSATCTWEMNEGAVLRPAQLLPALDYDVCVLTGDYRAATFGPCEAALEGLARCARA
jgi:hypothetical protein